MGGGDEVGMEQGGMWRGLKAGGGGEEGMCTRAEANAGVIDMR